jgi:glyoxylase-like metal-dependent hydrolase (beta-lactamase superfamily II)
VSTPFIREVRPGLGYWTAPHPQWKGATSWPEEVGCVYYEAADSLVLIDPLLPRGWETSFLETLDLEVERLGQPVAVLLTAPWHARDAASVAERYGTVVWAHPDARERLRFESQSGPLPDGLESFSPGGVQEGDVAFYIRPHRALVVAEFFLGVDGGLQVLPSPALRDWAAFEASLRSLLDWPIEHVLVSHGEPVIGDGRQRIEDALRTFAASADD